MRKLASTVMAVLFISLPAQAHEAEPLPAIPSWTVTHWRQEWATRAAPALTPELLGEWRWMQTHYFPGPERRSRQEPQKATPRPSNPAAASRTAYLPGVEQWRNLVAYFWPAEHVDRMLRIMNCESGGDPNVPNEQGSGALGLFQIMPFWQRTWPGDYTDPWTNASVAYQIWLSQGYGAWVCRG